MTIPLLLLLLVAPSSANDSLPTLKKCAPPIAPVGIVTLQSTLAFEVNAKGEPRPEGLSIVDMAGTSAAELHSLLARILPACTFKPGKHSPTIRVRTKLTIENGLLRWGPLSPALPGDTVDVSGLATPPALNASDTLAFTDSRLEERPAAVRCSERLQSREEVETKVRIDGRIVNVPPPGIPVPPPSTIPRDPAGVEVLLRYVVMTDGRVLPEDVVVVQSPSPEYAERARAKVSSCTWAPGRVGGVAVSVRIASRERF